MQPSIKSMEWMASAFMTIPTGLIQNDKKHWQDTPQKTLATYFTHVRVHFSIQLFLRLRLLLLPLVLWLPGSSLFTTLIVLWTTRG